MSYQEGVWREDDVRIGAMKLEGIRMRRDRVGRERAKAFLVYVHLRELAGEASNAG